MRLRLPALLLPLLLAACSVGADAAAGDGTGGSGGGGAPAFPYRYGGPLANAGADQRVLPGMPVRLDARASVPGEEALPLSYLWTQVAGPRVALDDPASAEPWFVAPSLRSGAGARLVFLLTVDDGARRSRDRVVVELVDGADEMVAAPVALAGEDLAVRPRASVDLGAPATLDPGCLDLGGAPGCERTPIAWRWTQVDGAPVELAGSAFDAPAYDAVLTFRLDATRAGDPAACGDAGPADGTTLCAAPDYVRVFVDGTSKRLARAPAATLAEPGALAPAGGLLRYAGNADGSYSSAIAVRGEWQPEATLFAVRPLLAGAPRGATQSLQLLLDRAVPMPDGRDVGGWPRTVAVAYETRAGRLFSRPTATVVRWEPPAAGALPPVARAGDDPCAGPSCGPFLGGDTVVLDASASSDPDTPASALRFCWRQTFGPPVSFAEGPACMLGEPIRTFVAPEAPAGGGAIQLAFLLTVEDDGPLISRPDTALVQIRPADDEPPEVVVVAPAAADEGTTVLLDASHSRDPEGGTLRFFWRRLPGPAGVGPVVLDEDVACAVPDAPPGACVAFTAPTVTHDVVLEFEVTAFDEAPLASSQRVRVQIRNSNNDPPVVDAGADRVVRPGEPVEIVASAHDENPGDDETLAYAWRVIEGGVTLQTSEGPVARFAAPAAAADRDVVLELTVTDAGGAAATDTVTISVLANGPYLAATGDDGNHGSAAAPVATLERALAIAAAHGFSRVHAGGGTFAAGASRLEGIEVRGGHDATAGWVWPADAETEIVAAAPLVLGAGASLERVSVVASAGSAAAELVRTEGDASVRSVRLDAAALTAPGAVAARVLAGTFVAIDSSIDGPAAAVDGGGLACAAGAIDVRNTAVAGGGGGGDHAGISLAQGCGGSVTDSTLVGGSGGEEQVGLWGRGGAPLVVERSVLRGGAGATTIGARLRGGLLRGCEVDGGSGTERIGLEVPLGATCLGGPCVSVEGGSIRGGAAAGGTAVGVRALSAVALDGVARIVGAEGDAQTATAVQLLAGGTVRDVAVLRGNDRGVATTATGLIAAGNAEISGAGDWVGGQASGEAVGIEVRGVLALDEAGTIAGSAGGAGTGIGIRILGGGSLSADALRVDGGAASATSRGIDVAADAAALQLANALVFAGPAPAAEALRAAGHADVHSSLLAVRDGSARASAVLVAGGGGGASLRNTILAAGTGPDRAHVREASGGLPAVLARVLFASDPGCGSGGAYVRTAGGATACTAAGIRALGAGWEPLVADPLFVDAAGGDFHLLAASPAVDAGTAVGAPPVDADGTPRGGDGNGDGTPGYDIGPFERAGP